MTQITTLEEALKLLEEHDMELLYYYMMRILFKGIAEPDMSIGEIMELV